MSHEKERQQYERDAQTSATPWVHWQARYIGPRPIGDDWADLGAAPNWFDGFEYRRKPTCATTFEFPPPETAVPVRGQPIYVADPLEDDGYAEMRWLASPFHAKLLYRGLVHLNPEDAKAHAQAMVYASRGAF